MEAEHRYIAVEGRAGSGEEAIKLCGRALWRAGLVEEAFYQECIDREREYPTGLCTDIPVAIPHCRSEAIKVSGVCYLRLKEPVVFRRMDDDEEVVTTRSIFNLAIKGAEDHLEFLRKMMGIVTDKDLMEQLEAVEIEKVPELLKKRF